MPGGYGTRDTPWGSAGTSSTPSRPERNVRASQPDRSNQDNRSNRIEQNIKDDQNRQAQEKADKLKAQTTVFQDKSQSKENKFVSLLNRLKEKGQGSTSQANQLKNYLYDVKTPAGSNLYFDWYQKTYPPDPLDVSSYDYGEYDLSPGAMGKGFGSVFGASSGVPGQSSKAVTDSLKFIMEDYINQGYEPEHAAQMSFNKFYVDDKVNYVNFMGDRNLPTSQQPAVQALLKGYPSGGGGGGGGGYGWGGGYGGGGGSGGGGGGYAPPEKFMPRGNPNEAWGAQMPLQQAMISIHGGKGFQQGFARGGIVSLVT